MDDDFFPWKKVLNDSLREKLVEKYARSLYDCQHPDAYTKERLATRNIPYLNEEEAQKYGKFKIERCKDINYYGKRPIEKYLIENLLILYHGEWKWLYLESEEGILYFSTDTLNWHRQLIKPQKRPYYDRIHKIKKFKVPIYLENNT